jgi:integrase
MDGITEVHASGCPRRAERSAACRCEPSWRATARTLTGERIRRQFKHKGEARTWKLDIEHAKRRGQMIVNRAPTVAVAADELVDGMTPGAIRNRSGDVYKPSVVDDYQRVLDKDVRPVLGTKRLDEVRRADVMRLVERLHTRGVSASRIRNTLMPLRVIFRRAVELEQVGSSPLSRITLPAVRSGRRRIATPDQAERMLAALTPRDRIVWALAFYGGLRRGEARGLPWSDVDFDLGVIHVRRAWCNRTRQLTLPKSQAAVRRVPMAGALRQLLLEHRLFVGRPDEGELIASWRKPGVPMAAEDMAERAHKAWAKVEDVPADFGLHEARHTYASLMIAAGVQPKALCEFMGHASITITLDLYGHLFPGAHADAAGLLDRYLDAEAAQRPRSQAGLGR